MEPNEFEVTTALDIVEKLMDKGLDKELGRGTYNWADSEEGTSAMEEAGVHYNCGATKFVLTCNTLENWVIKLSYEVSEEFAEETGITDFCGREADNYAEAISLDLDEYFASTWFVGVVNGHKVFLQEKVECNNKVFGGLFENYVRNTMADESWSDSDIEEEAYCLEDEQRIEAVFNDIPFKKLTALIDFCGDFEINDLHECNYGIRPDGTYAIIDFSGYSD